MHVAAATSPGRPTTPNEDWLAATSDLLVVLDGATVRTDTGCRHGVAWYTRKLGAAVIAAAASRTTPLTDVLREAIVSVAGLHSDTCDLSHPGTPSAAVGIVRLDGDALRYLVLGDITVVIDTTTPTGTPMVVMDPRISASARRERAEADRHPIGSPEKRAALLAMKYAELAARNTADGFWITAANPAVVSHALTGTVARASVRRLAVVSDGAARAVEMFGLFTWGSALDLLDRRGPEEFIGTVRAIEDRDPAGDRYPRNKASDDATVVYTRLAAVPTTATNPTPEQRAAALEAIQQHPVFAAMRTPGALMGEQRQPGWLPTSPA